MPEVSLAAPQVGVTLQHGDPATINVVSDDAVPSTLELWIGSASDPGTPLAELTGSSITGGRSYALSEEDSLALRPSRAYRLVARDSATSVTWFTGAVKPSTEGAPGPTAQTVRVALSELEITVELTVAAGAGGGGGGGGAELSSATPQALGTAAAGTATTASRADHVHAMPSAAQVGADPAGTASSAVSALSASLGDAALLDVGTTTGTVAAGDDSRLTNSRTPTGGAGGFLSGTYPDPGVNTEAFQDAVGAMAGTNLTYDDTAGTLNATGGSSEWTVDVTRTMGSTSASERFDSTTGQDLTGMTEFLVEIDGQCIDTSNAVVDVMIRYNNDTTANAHVYTLVGQRNGFITGAAAATSGRIGRLPGTLTNANRCGLIKYEAVGRDAACYKPGMGRYGLQLSNSTAATGTEVGDTTVQYLDTSALITRIDVFPATGSGFATGTKIRVRAR